MRGPGTKWVLVLTAACALVPASRLPAADQPADTQPAAENLAPNPGFESPIGGEGVQPESWATFTTGTSNSISLTRAEFKSGEQAIRISPTGTRGICQGVFADLPVVQGEKYTFSAFVRNSKEQPLGGSAEGLLVIEWHDSAGKELARDVGPRWSRTLSRMRWERFTMKRMRAPRDAQRARFGIHLIDGPSGGQGSMFVDDIEITR